MVENELELRRTNNVITNRLILRYKFQTLRLAGFRLRYDIKCFEQKNRFLFDQTTDNQMVLFTFGMLRWDFLVHPKVRTGQKGENNFGNIANFAHCWITSVSFKYSINIHRIQHTSWKCSASRSLISSSIALLLARSSSIFFCISSWDNCPIFSNLLFKFFAWIEPLLFSFINSSYSLLNSKVSDSSSSCSEITETYEIQKCHSYFTSSSPPR